MPIVSRDDLHKYMSEPEWSPGQKETATNLLINLEGQLEGKLYDAPITPRDPMTETAPVSPRGIVMTRYPVHSVQLIGGVVVDDDHPLTTPYRIESGYVRIDQTASSTYPCYPVARPHAAVTLTYAPGWGAKPALKHAILEKASTIMQHYHDDTLVARATDGQRLPQLPPREWTEPEIKALGIFRNLYVVM